MAKWTVLCWQEIPSVVEARDASGTHRVQLSERFQELIDLIAMRRKLAGTDDYLMEWRKEAPQECEGDAKAVAQAMADDIEGQYHTIKEKALANSPQ